jgi:valyl-tRNA synthetase
MAGYRAFGNKIWNATRFVLTKAPQGRVRPELSSATDGLALPERWILSEIERTCREVTESLENFRFDLACAGLYRFLWSDFCDWYIEMAKPGLEGAGTRPRVADVLVTVLERALRLLHPAMPHITEELWQRLPGHESVHPETICLAPWPEAAPELALSEADAGRVEILRQAVLAVRNDRAEAQLPPKTPAVLYLVARSEAGEEGRGNAGFLGSDLGLSLLGSLCGVSAVELGAPPTGSGVAHVASLLELTPVFERVAATIDRDRLTGELAEVEANLERVRSRLGNPGFTEKAPPAVIEGARRQLAELEARRERLAAVLAPSAGS